MSTRPRVRHRTIEVEAGYLPSPAVRLVITQCLAVCRDPPFWAWLIVGAFYDDEDNIVWSTEVFAGHLDIETETDDESGSEGSWSESEESDLASCKSDAFNSFCYSCFCLNLPCNTAWDLG